MRPTSLEFLAAGCGGQLLGNKDRIITDVKIDSRETCEGDLFVAYKGPSNDGHKYIGSAYDRGCRAFLVSDARAAETLLRTRGDAGIVLTDNTEYAFEMMAKAYIDQFGLIKIGITGSTGKTSTKALTTAVMNAKYRTVCSQKNYNTHLGIAMTCFLADETTEAIVIEMGMDRKNELYDYCKWVRPHAVMITNVGVVHMEYIGSREGIAEEKLKITSFLEEDQPLVYNCDSPFLTKDEILKRSSGRFRMIAAGESDEAAVKLSDPVDRGMDGISFELTYEGVKQHFDLPFPGLHNAHNGALAAAMGLQFGISLEEAARVMPLARIEDKRLEFYKIGDALLADSSYNANPDSMASVLRTFAVVPAKRKIAVIGDMRELGDATEESHVAIGKLISDLAIDTVVVIGENRAYYAEGTREGGHPVRVLTFTDVDEARSTVFSLIKPEDAILIKGSLSTNVHCLAEELRAKYC